MTITRPAVARIAERLLFADGYLGSQVINLREGFESGQPGAEAWERALEHAGRLYGAGLRPIPDDDRRTRMELLEVREQDGYLLRVTSDQQAALAALEDEKDVVTLVEWVRG